jgi:hypothetical protein
MPTAGNPVLKVRVEEEFKAACVAKAERTGTDISKVMRDALINWLAQSEEPQMQSLTNHIMSGTNGAPMPKVGDGATILMFSDRRPATITAVEVFKTGERKGQLKSVTVREDEAIVVSGNVQDGSAKYEFKPIEDHPTKTFTMNKRGQLVDSPGQHSWKLRPGNRDCYSDPSY